jgi:hypothetical protein
MDDVPSTSIGCPPIVPQQEEPHAENDTEEGDDASGDSGDDSRGSHDEYSLGSEDSDDERERIKHVGNYTDKLPHPSSIVLYRL